MNHKQAEYTLISFLAGFLLYLMFTSANIANRQKILNPQDYSIAKRTYKKLKHINNNSYNIDKTI